MDLITFDKTRNLWLQIAKHRDSNELSFELEVHKKLLNIFQVGDFYYYIFNCATASMEYVSDQIMQVLGLEKPEDFTIEYLFNTIHPDDLGYFVQFESAVTDFFNQLPAHKIQSYKVAYDYRIRHTKGNYVRLYQQTTTIQSDEHGGVIRVLGVHTDISHLKSENGSALSFIGLNGEPTYHDYLNTKRMQAAIFTAKEKEILKLLAQGKSSKDIAAELFLSKHTVDTHRRNMLKKTGTKSVVELISKCLSESWM